MKKGIKGLWFAAALVIASASQAAWAGKLYKWVDDKGVTHYSENMPAEQKDRSSTELDGHGRVLKQNAAAPSAEQIRAREDEKLRRKSEERDLEHQRRRDNALLSTYTTAGEIEDARKRAILAANQARQVLETRVKSAKSRADELRKQLDQATRGGKPAPPALAEDVEEAERDLARVERELAQRDAEIARIEQRYSEDKTRFVELTSSSAR
jgi:hypothetical protein